MTMSFDDPGGDGYEVRQGDLGMAFYVRIDGSLLGVASTLGRAMTLVRSDVARRRRMSMMQPVFHLAA